LCHIKFLNKNKKYKMKKLNLILFAAMLSFTACKDSKVSDESKESLATTETSTNVATPVSEVAAPATDATATTATGQTATTTATPNEPTAVPAVPTGPITTIQFDETTFDYGTVKDGEKVKHVYKFKNTGKNPLIISDAKGSCGCTVPDWPREPIAPGKTGEIKVEFDSKNKGTEEGSNQSKRVTITANTDPAQSYLTIKGIVKKDKAAASK
jgi:hypothetical protein